jgi:hypothetical protein
MLRGTKDNILKSEWLSSSVISYLYCWCCGGGGGRIEGVGRFCGFWSWRCEIPLSLVSDFSWAPVILCSQELGPLRSHNQGAKVFVHELGAVTRGAL